MLENLLISATHKSSGKTVVCIGLLGVFKKRGLALQAFKKGPDYIDSRWLSLASGESCYNLDFNTQNRKELCDFFSTRSIGRLGLIEGAKGLYDDIHADASTSSGRLAELLQTPVVLVIDCMGISTGIAPLLLGHIHFIHSVNIAGVILNRVGGERHQAKLRNAITAHVGIPIYGVIGRDSRLVLPERHLGLIPCKEEPEAESFIEKATACIEESVDCDALIELAQSKSRLSEQGQVLQTVAHKQRHATASDTSEKFRLGIFLDRAFHFYYQDDIESFIKQGAEIIYIDSLNDTTLPSDLDGLFIGGGFPETQAQALEQNQSLREQVKAAIEAGLPTYAECGGLMYLTRSIEWDGKKHNMVGVIPADTVMRNSPCGRGYIKVYESGDMPWPQARGNEGQILSGHEFHYAKLKGDFANCSMAFDILLGGEGINEGRDGFVYKNLLATFLHQRATESNRWTERFTEFIRKHQQA